MKKNNKKIMVNKTTRLTMGETVGSVVAGLVLGGAFCIGIYQMLDAATGGIAHVICGIADLADAHKAAKANDQKVKEYLLKKATDTEENKKV